MKNLIPLFRTDSVADWNEVRETVWVDVEQYYERLLGEMKENSTHLIYLCAPLKPTKQKQVQDHVRQALLIASEILGAEYKGRKIAVFIPHLHLFSVYNEILYPHTREKAIRFNNRLIREFFHTLVVVGNYISEGMAVEIEQAKGNGTEVIKIRDFKKQLNKMPNSQKSKTSYEGMVKLHNKIHGQNFLIKR